MNKNHKKVFVHLLDFLCQEMKKTILTMAMLCTFGAMMADEPEETMDPRAAAAPMVMTMQTVKKEVTPEADKLCIEGMDAAEAGDPAKALELLTKSADMGNPQAMYNLGVYYLKGLDGFERSDSEAIRWFTLGTQNGDGESAYQLAMMFYRGQGVDANESEALQLFKHAEALGYKRAHRMVEQLEQQ